MYAGDEIHDDDITSLIVDPLTGPAMRFQLARPHPLGNLVAWLEAVQADVRELLAEDEPQGRLMPPGVRLRVDELRMAIDELEVVIDAARHHVTTR